MVEGLTEYRWHGQKQVRTGEKVRKLTPPSKADAQGRNCGGKKTIFWWKLKDAVVRKAVRWADKSKGAKAGNALGPGSVYI